MIINFLGREIYVKKEVIAVVIPMVVIALGFTGFLISSGNKAIIIETTVDAPSKSEWVDTVKENTESPTSASDKVEDEIKVHVAGCVKNPGIVTLKKGQIIDDAIQLAGGVTEEADLNKVNRVYILKENVMLYIKSREESKAVSGQPINQQWAAAGEAGPGIEIISDSAGAVMNTGSEDKAPKKININKASEKELETLPGIGKETAKDIISYREKNGLFKTIEEIMKVSGIKENRFNNIKDLITVE